MAEVLTPDSDRWDAFANTLYLALYPDGGDKRSVCLGDSGPGVHRYAKEVMRDMGGIDIAASLNSSWLIVAIATARSCTMLILNR